MPVFGFGFLIFFLALAAFWIWALVDCLRVPDDSMYQYGNKVIWVLVIVLLQTLGAIIYLVVGRPKPGTPPPGSWQGPQMPPPPPV